MNDFSISAEAAQYIKQKLDERGLGGAIRVGIRGGMCDGYAYHIEFTDVERESDYKFEKDGIVVLVDAKSMLFLKGAVLDYEKTLLNHGLRVINPNAATSCGCGKSFSIK